MGGSSTGKIFTVTTWGESHGAAIGAVVDGCPSGIPLSPADFAADMSRRKPKDFTASTSRVEADTVEILSGVFEGVTTGTAISLLIRNENVKSGDYSNVKDTYRPGHADFTYDQKYGFRDYRGGGRSSGRETAARVAAGVIAKKILEKVGVSFLSYVSEIAGIKADYRRFDANEAEKTPYFMPDKIAAEKVAIFLNGDSSGNSYGGIVECVISGVPVGLGEPVFDKLDAALSAALFSIGAVKGVEVGAGFYSARSTGEKNNDEFALKRGKPAKATNNAGGISGGMSDGSDIILRCAVKPTPSISLPQKTIDQAGNEREITINGRHDKVIAPRAVVVAEAMAAIVLTDYLFINMSSRIDKIESFYKNI
ncbi:chorismate synthase [Clostridia bacterium]|nr:chorismate synthase [Clostridia bacterium]